jgi:O-antigen/teichoic acid export membrane protein
MWVVARRYAKFPLYELPSVVLDAAALSLPVPMIASVYGVAASGWFGLARTLVAIPNTQIGAAVADVFQMELANAVRAQDHARARKLFYQLLKKLALFGLLPMAAIMVFAPWLAGMVLGKAWSEVGMLSACIAPWLYASLVVGSLSRLASVLEAQRSKLVYDVVAIGLMLAAYSIAKHQSFGMMMMVVSFTVANFIAYMIYLAVLLRIVWTRL